MAPQLFDRLQLLTPGSEKYRRILRLFERHTLSGVMARLVTESDPEARRRLEETLRRLLDEPEPS
jgi:hypothetical protein